MRNDHLDSPDKQADGLSLASLLRYKVAWVRLRFSSVWPDIRDFSRWVEASGNILAEAGHECLAFEISPQGQIKLRKAMPPEISSDPDRWPNLCNFLGQLGISIFELDPRLESDQVADIMVLLFTYRRALRQDRRSSPRMVPGLLRNQGVLFACTQTQIRNDTLVIAYSYCQTRFSRLVGWFEQRQTDFRDHRALFRAAPKYGLFSAVIVGALFVICTLTENLWFRLAIMAVGAGVLFAVTYLSLMTIGSLEYDNEEKAYRLKRTYERLRLYANRIQNDLAQARTIQQKLIPKPEEMPLANSIDWASSFIPQSEVGGDYYDVAQIGPNRAAILFSDVSGHGMSAALVTTIIKTVFQSWVEQVGPLADFVKYLNLRLCQLTPTDSFATALLATFDADKRKLHYVNCGHNPEPLLVPAALDEPIRSLGQARSLILGVQEELVLEQASICLKPGDTVVMVTDGIIESRGPDGEFYGQGRLEQFLTDQRGKPVKEMVASLREEMKAFIGQAEQSDDQTMLAFQVRQR